MTRILLISLLLVATISCKEDGPKFLVQDITGKWVISEAYKSGKRSKLLENGLFVFNQDTTMSTNFLGKELPFPYTIEKSTVLTVNQNYNVLKLTSDTLILEADIRKVKFRFITLKQK